MERRIVPFYMAYPLPVNYQDEQEMVRDMEYLQSQHSMEIRQLRKHIADTINIMDYEGSMIYDEYPDRFSMERQSKMISQNLKKTYEDDESCAFHKMLFWDGFEDIVRLLVYDEILKRRHRRKKGYLQF